MQKLPLQHPPDQVNWPSLEHIPWGGICPKATPFSLSEKVKLYELIYSPHQHWEGGIISALLRVKVKIAQSCPTLCDPMDCSLPGSSVHGILQARILGWVTVCFSRGSSQPRDQTQIKQKNSLKATLLNEDLHLDLPDSSVLFVIMKLYLWVSNHVSIISKLQWGIDTKM